MTDERRAERKGEPLDESGDCRECEYWRQQGAQWCHRCGNDFQTTKEKGGK